MSFLYLKKKEETLFEWELVNCLNFWDEAWWFLSLRVFGHLSSSYCYIVISTTFRPICPPAFFRCLLNLHGTSNYILYWIHGGRLFWFCYRRWFPKPSEFDKHLKKVGGHVGRNIVEIIIKMKTIVRKPLMIKKEVDHVIK